MIDERDETEVADLEDEYELLNELGRGGSAVEYRARDKSLGREVAIKVVHTRVAGASDDAIARLAREARTVAKLQHPNIVTVYAVRRLREGGLALVMQLVPGRTLKQAIVDDGAFSPDKAESVLRDVAQALAYAHTHGVVHRDVKPENIFLDSLTGRAMLSDFGIAHSNEYDSRLTMTGAAIGTPAYMSPEQIDGAPANARSDVYSLGLVSWEMLTGERPWEGETLYNVIFKQKHEELPTIDELRPGVVKPSLQYIVERMLQKKPAARWNSAETLLASLTTWTEPGDWRQWEAAHQRRRDLVKAATKGKAPTPPNIPAAFSLATVRFPRPKTPSSDQVVIPAEAEQRTTIAVTDNDVADYEDDAPSWASEPELPPKRAWKSAALIAASLLLIAGSVTAYGVKVGRIHLPAALASRLGIGRNESNVIGLSSVGLPDTTHAKKSDSTSLAAIDSAALAAAHIAAGTLVSPDSIAKPAAPSPNVAIDRPPASTVNVLPGTLAAPNQTPVGGRGPGALARVPIVAPPSAPAPINVAAPFVANVRATDDRGTIAAGGRHSCVLSTARVFCWGGNDRGQLGNGELEARDTPNGIVGDIEFAQVSAGRAHTCGVTRGGDAYCWGSDERGQLGDATTTSRSAPVRVAGNLSFQFLRAGVDHTCGLTTSGDIACWGSNEHGQLGDGTTSSRSAPVTLKTSLHFISLAVGSTHSCALTSDGVALCWGDNSSGQLGDDSRKGHHSPEPIAGSLHFTSISGGNGHTCGVSDSGDTYCWGKNSFGQLGTGNTTDQNAPAKVETAARFASVTLGAVHTCGRTRAGQAWCWGRNVYGQLGDGSTTNHDTPVRVAGPIAFASISATGAHTCGSSIDGEAACWGYNTDGQLGDGTHDHHSRPARVTLPGR